MMKHSFITESRVAGAVLLALGLLCALVLLSVVLPILGPVTLLIMKGAALVILCAAGVILLALGLRLLFEG